VNGAPIATPVIVADEAIIRAGRNLFLLEWHASRRRSRDAQVAERLPP
jgi:hypothetical protein